jgi:SAM-dependent methyltransferase
VLDVGCASGSYLLALRDKGWDVHGIEIDAGAARYAREQHGLPVRAGAAEAVLSEYSEEQFDLVTMWHVLEHLHDPYRVLSEAHRIIKPGGTLMFEVPNYASLPSTLFGKYWFTLEAPRHLYHFTPRTLTRMLSKAGFGLRRLRGVPAPQAIAWSLHIARDQWVGNSQVFEFPLNPMLLGLLFPVDWLMARFRLSSVVNGMAVRLSSDGPQDRCTA